MTKRELEAEVERLRAELVLVRSQQAAHACPSLACTCNSAAMPTTCPVHGWVNVWRTTGCAAPNPVMHTVWPNAGAAQPWPAYIHDYAPAMGAAPVPQIMTFNVPA